MFLLHYQVLHPLNFCFYPAEYRITGPIIGFFTQAALQHIVAEPAYHLQEKINQSVQLLNRRLYPEFNLYTVIAPLMKSRSKHPAKHATYSLLLSNV